MSLVNYLLKYKKIVLDCRQSFTENVKSAKLSGFVPSTIQQQDIRPESSTLGDRMYETLLYIIMKNAFIVCRIVTSFV